MREETPDTSKIYCFGDTRQYLRFNVGPMIWSALHFDEKGSSFEGNLKYFSAVFVPERKVYMTGGCFTNTAQPSSQTFQLDLFVNADKPIKKKNMLLKRYGHQSAYLNGFIYAIGGFSHKDMPNEMPITLASCERYSIVENAWQYISTMSEARAFAGHITLDN